MISVRPKGILAVCALALALAASACSSSGASANGASGGAQVTGGGVYTAAQVATASGSYKVVPIFAVPKHLPKKYMLAFISPSLSFPYFATWSQGMQAAAKFYGVALEQADLNFNYANELSAYNTLSVKGPDVVGSGIMNEATYTKIKHDGAKIVLIDGQFNNAPWFGVNDQQVGKLAIDTMAAQVKAKMAGAWKGRKVDVVGITAPNCTPCDTRVKASFAKAESTLQIPAADTFMLTPRGQDPTTSAGTTFTNFLTAHPHDAVVVVSYGDETVIGAINAAKAANRAKDILAVSNGGDTAARIALRDPSNAGILVAAIDYEPYQEGWNWVEAAIVTALGKQFAKYNVDRILTAENVNQYYPNDKK